MEKNLHKNIKCLIREISLKEGFFFFFSFYTFGKYSGFGFDIKKQQLVVLKF